MSQTEESERYFKFLAQATREPIYNCEFNREIELANYECVWGKGVSTSYKVGFVEIQKNKKILRVEQSKKLDEGVNSVIRDVPGAAVQKLVSEPGNIALKAILAVFPEEDGRDLRKFSNKAVSEFVPDGHVVFMDRFKVSDFSVSVSLVDSSSGNMRTSESAVLIEDRPKFIVNFLIKLRSSTSLFRYNFPQ